MTSPAVQRSEIEQCIAKHRWKLVDISFANFANHYELLREDGLKTHHRILFSDLAQWSLIPQEDPRVPDMSTLMVCTLLLAKVISLNSVNPMKETT